MIKSGGIALLLALSHVLMGMEVQKDKTLQLFEQFVRDFDKKYVSAEERSRRINIFAKNVEEIEKHNTNRQLSWSLGINQFSDLTVEEFRSISWGYTGPQVNIASSIRKVPRNKTDGQSLPKNKDWRTEGIISDVTKQGPCGSCWAHSAMEQIESYYAIKYPEKWNKRNSTEMIFSVEEIIDCMPNPDVCGGEGGCGGSAPWYAYNWAQDFGITTSKAMPCSSCIGHQPAKCDLEDIIAHKPRAVFTRGYEILPANDLDSIMNHLAFVGPLSIVVDANWPQSYNGGVFRDCTYGEDVTFDHAVQLVGYGENEEEGKYWIVRNSWGESWGENGYIRIQRDEETRCGNAKVGVCHVTLELGIEGPVCGPCGLLHWANYPIIA